MREPIWKRLGLDKDEWRDCRVSAREMTLASGARVRPAQVAVEYVLARTFDEPALPAPPFEGQLPAGPRRTKARRWRRQY